MTVELLRDGRGIYGIGVSDLYGPDAALSEIRKKLILRPDMFQQFGRDRLSAAVLQKITSGGIFRRSYEETLRQVIQDEELTRVGLPTHANGARIYWSRDKKQQDRNWRFYHALWRVSLHVINKLVGIALQEAADPDALKVARRFAYDYRELIYRAGATSRRALQLAEAFPVLALAVYCPETSGAQDLESSDRETLQEATDLVERGARLREVAAVMRIPMALRRVKPGAAHLVVGLPLINPQWIISHMPDSLPRMRVWLCAVYHAHLRAGARSDFAEWTARHASQIPVGSQNEFLSFLNDTADWVRASHGNYGYQFVVRPFKPTMSLRTVTRLSAEWHEAVASNLTGPQHTFPEPWLPATTINGLEIIPIDNSADLYREARFMHHCIGTYADEVRGGRYCVYSIRRNGERVASAGLVLQGARAELDQLRGPCNAAAPKQITATVDRWLRTQASRRGGETVT